MPQSTGQAIFSGLGESIQKLPMQQQMAQQQTYQNAIAQMSMMLKALDAEQRANESKANIGRLESQMKLNTTRSAYWATKGLNWENEITAKAEANMAEATHKAKLGQEMLQSAPFQALTETYGDRSFSVPGYASVGAPPRSGAGGQGSVDQQLFDMWGADKFAQYKKGLGEFSKQGLSKDPVLRSYLNYLEDVTTEGGLMAGFGLEFNPQFLTEADFRALMTGEGSAGQQKNPGDMTDEELDAAIQGYEY